MRHSDLQHQKETNLKVYFAMLEMYQFRQHLMRQDCRSWRSSLPPHSGLPLSSCWLVKLHHQTWILPTHGSVLAKKWSGFFPHELSVSMPVYVSDLGIHTSQWISVLDSGVHFNSKEAGMSSQKLQKESGSHTAPQGRLCFQPLKDLKAVRSEWRRLSTASLTGSTDTPHPPSVCWTLPARWCSHLGLPAAQSSHVVVGWFCIPYGLSGV